MPEYLAPGVYLEEIQTNSRVIEGVSTSTAGFVGPTARGPTRLTLVRSWQEYTRRYGGWPDPHACDGSRFLPYAVRGFFENGGARLVVARVTGRAAATAAASFEGARGCMRVQAIGPGTWGNNVAVAVKPATEPAPGPDGGAWKTFRLQVAYYADGIPEPLVDPADPAQVANPARREPTLFEDFDNVSLDPAAPKSAIRFVNARSELVEIAKLAGLPAATGFAGGRLRGGVDAVPTADDYRGAPAEGGTPQGLAALAAIGGISVMAIPDAVTIDGLHEALLDTCTALADRFAVVCEPDPGRDVALIRPPRDTGFGATYFPWIGVPAPDRGAATIFVPPVGHVCGIYARVDASRGVHKAPANEAVRGLVAGGDAGPPVSRRVSHAEQELLNPRGVNVIREIHGEADVRVWGSRTMASDREWKYVNVRRLFIFLEHSIDRGLQWVVFEPNQEETWAAVRRSVSDFLQRAWFTGALAGATPDDAFFVKCDRTTMTQDDIDNGRLVCLVGAAPIRPAEFVIFRIGQWTLPPP
jgi:phage tail sheath protein FI